MLVFGPSLMSVKITYQNLQMIDTTELEELRESNKAYKAENDRLRLEVVQLKIKLKKAEEEASTSRFKFFFLKYISFPF